MIKAVFFDVDDTLYDFDRVRRYGLNAALQRLYERLPDTRGRVTLEHLIRLRDQVDREQGNSSRKLIELRTESFRRALAMCGYGDDLAVELTDVYRAHRWQYARPYEGTLAALRHLRGRYVLGIISNANTPLSVLGLDGCFDHEFYAEAVGIAKPDPRIFEMAMNAVPCMPQEFLFVGDSVEFDVMGAMNAGARSAWFNPRGQPYPDGLARPDFEISDLAELVEIVEGIASCRPPH